MAEKSSSSSSSEIVKALEGEPIITWTCAVLKQCLRSQGGRLTGKKEYLVWRQIVHLVTKGWSVISTESLPCLVFTELSSVTKTPRLALQTSAATTLEKFCFWTFRGRRQDNEVGRQRSQGCTACTDWVTLWWCTFCPSAFRLVNFMRNFFHGSRPISNKKKLSQFLLKKKNWSGFVNEQ